MAGRTYRDLLVWQKAMQLVTDVYKVTENFPKTETFGLRIQVRRAIVSVPSNIVEGQGRDSQKEFVHHLSIAYGSLVEAETQIQIASNLAYIENSESARLLTQCDEVGRLLNGLLRSLRKPTDN
jgi:four helix bundle protein